MSGRVSFANFFFWCRKLPWSFQVSMLVVLFPFLASCDFSPYQAADNRVDVPGGVRNLEVGAKEVDLKYLKKCREGIASVEIYTRGRLNSGTVFLPERSIHTLRARGKYDDYPVSLVIDLSCLKSGEVVCSGVPSDFVYLQASVPEFNGNRLETLLRDRFLEKQDSFFHGLEFYKFSDDILRAEFDKGV